MLWAHAAEADETRNGMCAIVSDGIQIERGPDHAPLRQSSSRKVVTSVRNSVQCGTGLKAAVADVVLPSLLISRLERRRGCRLAAGACVWPRS